MSQVIPNHILRVGQSIRITSQEEHGGLHPSGCPSSLSRSPKCTYFTTERWVDQGVMGQSPGAGHAMPHGGLYGTDNTHTCVVPDSNLAFKEAGKMPHAQGNGHPYFTMEGSARDLEPETNQTASAMSPTLDISIDNLNRLILELDPTFQPLSGKKNAHQAASPGWTEAARTQGQGFSDLKDSDAHSARAWCEAAARRSARPSPSQLSSSPRSDCILVARGTPSSNCTTANGSVIFSGGSQPSSSGSSGHQSRQRLPSTGSNGHSCQQASGCAPAAPQEQKERTCQPLLFSLGHENPSMPLHIPARSHHRSSAVSTMSNSPGSDTSYILGSSAHSIISDGPDHFNCRFAESPFGSMGSFSNLNSPTVSSPMAHRNYFGDHNPEMFSAGLQHPNGPPKMNSCSPPSKKGHASSCPPSIANSTVDIPILLVNGCTEYGEGPPSSSRADRNTVKRRVSTNFNQGSGNGYLNKTTSDSALSSSNNPVRSGQPTMKFVMDTSKYWFKPNLHRDQVIELLKGKEPGAFVVRDSTSYQGSFGLAMKVPFTPSAAHKSGDQSSDQIRHFLIESSPKGVHVKGASDEPYFGSLSALVYQHAILPLSLPCKLAIPCKDFCDGESSPESSPESAVLELKRTAACNVLYLTSVSMETLTGTSAIQKAVSATFQMETLPAPTIVHFKATEQGITLTDVQRKIFFRRHYPLATISYCGLDPEDRQWQKHCRSSRIFGFVSKSQTDAKDNTCHLFAEYDIVQPVSPVIGLVVSLLQGV